MKKDTVNTKNTLCPVCEDIKTVEVVSENSSIELRGELVTYQDHFYKCLTCGSKIDSDENPDVHRDYIYPKYRKIHKYVTPEEIRSFRKLTGLTQKEMSKFLGWGEVTLSRYENGALQDDAHDTSLRMFMSKGGFESAFWKRPDIISNEKYRKIQILLGSERRELLKAIVELSNRIRRIELNVDKWKKAQNKNELKVAFRLKTKREFEKADGEMAWKKARSGLRNPSRSNPKVWGN